MSLEGIKIKKLTYKERRKEEIFLAKEIRKGSREAVAQLIEINYAYLIRYTREFHRKISNSVNEAILDDLLIEAVIGMIRAAEKYDIKKGRFITYATWWMRQRLNNATSDLLHQVRLPPKEILKIRKIGKAEREIQGISGKKASREEIALRLNLSIAEIEELLQVVATGRSFSLESQNPRMEDDKLSDTLPDINAVNPEKEILKNEIKEILREAISKLKPKSARVIIERFGLDGNGCATLQKIAEELNLSRERIRQMEKQAIADLGIILRKKRNKHA